MQRPIARKGGINMYNDQIVGVRFFISISNNDLDERVYYYKASALETFKKGDKVLVSVHSNDEHVNKHIVASRLKTVAVEKVFKNIDEFIEGKDLNEIKFEGINKYIVANIEHDIDQYLENMKKDERQNELKRLIKQRAKELEDYEKFKEVLDKTDDETLRALLIRAGMIK